MDLSFSGILVWLYGAAGLVSIFAYIPTITDLRKQKPSANISTYILWTIGAFITFLYAIFINKDLMFVLVVLGQLIMVLTILILSIRLKYFFRKQINKKLPK